MKDWNCYCMCRQMMEEVRRGEQEAVGQDLVRAVGRFFPILQREKEIHDLVHHMGYLRAWSKDIPAAGTIE